jgi:hypothetical protein
VCNTASPASAATTSATAVNFEKELVMPAHFALFSSCEVIGVLEVSSTNFRQRMKNL